MTIESPPRWVQLTLEHLDAAHAATLGLRKAANECYAAGRLREGTEYERLAEHLQAVIVHVNIRGKSL